MSTSIIDCTLREGCQTKQANFTIEQSIAIASELSKFGVDMIECGHPCISTLEFERVKAVVKASTIPVLSHSRCAQVDIEAVKATGAQWIGLFISLNEISMKSKFAGKSKRYVKDIFKESIKYAKQLGLSIRATIEDAGRTSLKDLASLLQIASDQNVERVCFADSVGILMPSETFDVLSLLRHEFKDLKFEYHVHNDQGLALANTLEAIRAGVEWCSTSCNGIGERAGITDTFQLATLLQTKFNIREFNLRRARYLSKLVEVYSRIKCSPMQPFIGENCYIHAARLHKLAMQVESSSYTIVNPEIFGADIELNDTKPFTVSDCFIEPFEKPSTELKYHTQGPGKRFVMIDKRLFETSPYYFIARQVNEVEANVAPHVEFHVHVSDSVFLFLGSEQDYKGLTVEVCLNDELRTLHSPATVFIPAGYPHTYRFIKGSGTYINFVNCGNYNDSLLEEFDETV